MSEQPVGIKQIFKEVAKSKAGALGFALLVAMLILAMFTPILAPYNVARAWNDLRYWQDNPALAAPAWVRFLSPNSYSGTVTLSNFSLERSFHGQYTLVRRTGSFVYMYDVFPTEVRLLLDVNYTARKPRVIATLERPDGKGVTLYNGMPVKGENVVSVSVDPKYQKLIGYFLYEELGYVPAAIHPEIVLFAKKSKYMNDRQRADVLKGTYILEVDAISFEKNLSVQPKLIVYGNSYGIAGTDNYRRDLTVGLMWGAPVALAFGTIAAVVTVLLQVVIGAAGAWIGPRADEIVQRAADFFLVIPVLPILILINVVYTINIWLLLSWVILFSIVGGVTKISRSMVLQIREEQYVEAALSYGASKKRILTFHILPRIIPYTFALIALSAPSYVFLEAALSFLGLGDPNIPSWGRLLGQAFDAGALYYGWWWWVIFPALMIMLVSLGFTLLSYAFDKVVNPRLREE